MRQYKEAMKFILDNGVESNDRTGEGTISYFGLQMRFNLAAGFPAVTTKKLAWKAMVSELLWFLEGSGDERRLCEILHGTRDDSKKTIWSDNANAEYWKPKSKFNGDLGNVYGVQWRSWGGQGIDQIANLIAEIKRNPFSRRLILTAWNVSQLDQMALPPCHTFSQFYVRDGKLSCLMFQRSADFFLGVPFNIASYSLLTHMIAQVCDLKVGEFIHNIGDAHIYLNHLEQVKEQLNRDSYSLPTLWINPDVKDIDHFKMTDFELLDYRHHPSISAPMAV